MCIRDSHKPYMERRIYAAWNNYWPQMPFRVTSYPQTMEEYLASAKARGRDENATINMLVGDFQRVDAYAKLGYQIPQEIPDAVWQAFHELVAMGYTQQLIP